MQVPETGVTSYVAVATALVVLVKDWLIIVTGVLTKPDPVIELEGLITGADHVYKVAAPIGTVVGATLNEVLLQIFAVCVAIVGVGFTVCKNVKLLPVQPSAIGVAL